jgi:ribosomal protein S18 acetylase RimI-like enzyme
MNFVLKIQENKALLRCYRILSSVVQVVPYYVIEEGFFDQKHTAVAPRILDPEISLLTRDDMEFIGRHKENPSTTEEYMEHLESGCICLAVKSKGEIAAYSWCDPNYLKFKGKTVVLNRNEAYLFDARTYKAFRGKNLAPYVRYELYKLMQTRGVERFYSITLFSNDSSMKFKLKMGAKPKELFLYVGLLRRYNFHFRLRRLDRY